MKKDEKRIKKTLNAVVVSVKMAHTAVVEIVRKTPHPMYRKLLKRSKRYKVDSRGTEVAIGDIVSMAYSRPLSKDKHFKIEKVIKKGEVK